MTRKCYEIILVLTNDSYANCSPFTEEFKFFIEASDAEEAHDKANRLFDLLDTPHMRVQGDTPYCPDLFRTPASYYILERVTAC
jgi:hypothetical protein